jgi:hypothetical protein
MIKVKFCLCIFAILLSALLLLGCSRGTGNPLLLSDVEIDLAQGENHAPGLIGIYEIEIDASNLSGDVHSLRTSQVLGDSYSVDITPFLTIEPCSDCLRIQSIRMDGEFLDVDFLTKHPFKPENRYDLNVFDLRGIIVTGEYTTQFDRIPVDIDGDGVDETVAEGNLDFLVDPDGFTTFYDAAVEDYLNREFDGNICPFKNLWVNPQINPPGTNYDPKTDAQHGFTDLTDPYGHNVFPMGGSFGNPLSKTTYRFDFTDVDTITFLLVLEASYAHTAMQIDRKNPRYFLPEFHRKEAWKVDADLYENNLYAGDWMSTARVNVRVVDWQAGMTPDPAWTYATSDLTTTRYASDIRDLLVDIPGILDDPLIKDLSNIESGDGSVTDPYLWDIGFSNEKSAPSGIYWGLVAVHDDLEGSSNAPVGISGDITHPVPLSDITVYQAFKVAINATPEADLLDDDADNILRTGANVKFQPGPGTSDPDGSIIKYEYDFDYNGSSFSPDEVQNEGDGDFGDPVFHTFLNPSPSDILVTVAFKVTDDGSPALSAYDTVVFTVKPETGILLFEDFESTSGTTVPSGWGVTGRLQNAYWLGTNGGGCEDASWRWGVTVNASQGDGGESHFLNEDGFTHPTADLDYTYQNRATIAYTPEFEVPTNGALMTIRQWYDLTIVDIGIERRWRDGCLPILSLDNPGTVDWEDFCDIEPQSHHPKRTLPVIGGPVYYDFVSGFAAGGHPLRGWACHTETSGGWVTSQYLISPQYAGEMVRVGFLFASDDLERNELSDCDPRGLAEAKAGWRINWVSIQEY